MGARIVWHPAALRRFGAQALPPAADTARVDACTRLSPAAAVARGCGGPITRLDGRWAALLRALPVFTDLTATVQDGALYQVARGRASAVEVGAAGGYIGGPGLDLRVFTAGWAHGFAAAYDNPDGPLRMLAFFDAAGEPALGLRVGTARGSAAFDALVARHRHADQQPGVRPVAVPAPPPVAPLPSPPARLGAECYPLFSGAALGRQQALQAAGPSLARAVDPRCIGCLLRIASEQRRELAWLAGTPGALLGHAGAIARVTREGDRLRLGGRGFLGEFDPDAIAHAWVVHRPGRAQVRTTLELYRRDGRLLAALTAAGSAPGGGECVVWRALLLGLPGVLH